VTDFAPFLNADEIFLDSKKTFFRALGYNWASVQTLLLPQVWQKDREARRKGIAGNLKGEGRLMGGLLVVTADNGVVYQFQEKFFGDHASLDEVLLAVGGSSKM